MADPRKIARAARKQRQAPAHVPTRTRLVYTTVSPPRGRAVNVIAGLGRRSLTH